MANSNTFKAFLMFNLALILSLVFIPSIAESRVQPWAQSEAGTEGVTIGELICFKAYGAQAGDTCIQVAQVQNITMEKFGKLNPNLVCQKLFVGEWLCVDGNV